MCASPTCECPLLTRGITHMSFATLPDAIIHLPSKPVPRRLNYLPSFIPPSIRLKCLIHLLYFLYVLLYVLLRLPIPSNCHHALASIRPFDDTHTSRTKHHCQHPEYCQCCTVNLLRDASTVQSLWNCFLLHRYSTLFGTCSRQLLVLRILNDLCTTVMYHARSHNPSQQALREKKGDRTHCARHPGPHGETQSHGYLYRG